MCSLRSVKTPPPPSMSAMAGDSRLILIFPFLLLHLFPLVQSQEQEVLLKLKSHWGGPPSLKTWNSSTPPCNWTGITCTNNTVTNITLRNYLDIAGDVPPFVCNLTNLAVLDLYNNSINNTFPDLSGCRSLAHLDLSQNYLVGTIPDDIGEVLSGLVYLNILGNYFYGDFPGSISRASALRELYLDLNSFNGSFPEEVANISSLEVLSLSSNPFRSWNLPPKFGNLKNLMSLNVSNASLIGEIPETFGELVALQELELWTNNLTGRIPTGIWSLKNLSRIILAENNLHGELPATVDATKLVYIHLSTNRLSGSIPEDFGKLQKLKYLFLYRNKFSGEIPVGIANISTLTDIRLFKNSFTGRLPPELGKHSKLYNFEVSENKLTGELPPHLCKAGILIALIVFDNNLTGELPESLGNCLSLQHIQLYNNRFTGEFPSQIWSLTSLNVVIIKDNDLSGELPDVLPRSFTRVEIANNRFSGKIPSKARNLKVFYGSNNEFSEELPSDMNGLSNLQQLRLGRNRLSGAIPASIRSLESLTDLNLSRNYLTGDIPATIRSLPVLTSLDLSNNNLSGEIPGTMGKLNLNSLNLSFNSLSGPVPPQFENAAYADSFLSNPDLCSLGEGATTIHLPLCGSQSKPAQLSKGWLALFISLGTVIFLAAAVFAFFAVRNFRRRKTSEHVNKWKLTPFSALNFTQTNIIGGFTPENLIGSGASGQVYKVDVGGRAGGTVAVKSIRNRRLDPKLEKAFYAEVGILGSIRHINIVRLLCCISSPESKLLVYDYMKNGSLDQWLQKKRVMPTGSGREVGGGGLDWPTRLAIAVGAARGLSYMHYDCQPPIVHRDVKSSNILLDAEFTPKVADFGLARILANSNEPQTVSSFAGSIGYMAPECAYTNRVNEKMDVYSFGVVLLELTTGKQAAGDCGTNVSLVEWVWRHVQDGRSPADILDDDIRNPKWLEEISVVMRLGLLCTGTLPSSRPTMKDVLQVLLKYHQSTKLDVGTGEVDDGGLAAELPPPLAMKGSRRSRSVKTVSNEDDDKSGLLFNL